MTQTKINLTAFAILIILIILILANRPESNVSQTSDATPPAEASAQALE